MEFKQILSLLKESGQMQVLNFLPQLTQQQKSHLLTEISSLDLQLINRLCRTVLKDPGNSQQNQAIQPAAAVDINSFSKVEKNRILKSGYHTLKNGQVAVFLVAGGQGTRLGFKGPKGTAGIGLPSGKSLFELQAQRLKALSNKIGRDIHWYIMTSPSNHQETVTFFQEHHFFGLPPSSLMFFSQESLPAVDSQGKIILAEPWKLSLSPNGNGGCFSALVKSGALEDMEKRGVKYVFFYGVDNALIKIADPFFVGWAAEEEAQVACKAVAKASPEEKVGVLVQKEGRPAVIEYSEIPPGLLHQKTDAGNLVFNTGNIGIHLFHLDFLKQHGAGSLPYHRAHKKIKTVDSSGQPVSPSKPNGYKFEQFMFDIFPQARTMSVLMVNRNQEFAPVKNAEGADSPQSAKDLLLALHEKTRDATLI